MSNDKLYDIIEYPIYTEKATNAASYSKYTFRVSTNATKAQVKRAVEGIFDKTVEKVNVVTLPSKKKIFKGRIGRRSGYKKAIVTLKQGQTIENIMGA